MKRYVSLYCEICRTTKTKCGKLNAPRTCRICGREQIFQCKECDLPFTTYPKMINHLKHKCQSDLFWKCPECHYRVMDEEKLHIHIKKIHEDKRIPKKPTRGSFVCTNCNEDFTAETDLRNHERSCFSKPRFHCESCAYKTKVRYHIRQHLRSAHQTLKGGYVTVIRMNQMKSIRTINFFF